MTLAVPAPPKPKVGATGPTPWRVSAKIKADHAKAQFEQIDGSYGTEERALKFAGLGDIRFGASPLLHADLSARQLDADRLIASDAVSKGNPKDTGAEPVRLLPALRALMTAAPHPPFPARIEFSAEQITLGGRPLQNSGRRSAGRRRGLEHRPAGFRERPAERRLRSAAPLRSPATPRARSTSTPPIRMC